MPTDPELEVIFTPANQSSPREKDYLKLVEDLNEKLDYHQLSIVTFTMLLDALEKKGVICKVKLEHQDEVALPEFKKDR